MILRDLHKLLSASIGVLSALGGGALPAHAQGTVTAFPTSGIQIATSVNVAYQAIQNTPAISVTSNTATVVVRPTAGVVLTPALSSQRLLQPSRAFYPVTVQNTGSGTDTFTLAVTQIPGWAGTLMSSSGSAVTHTQMTLAAGQSRTLLLTMTPLSVLPRAASNMIVLKVVSGVDPTQYAQAAVVTMTGSGKVAYAHS